MNTPDTVMALAASYPDEASAEADNEAVKALYHEIRTSHDFDAAVISRDEDGKVHVVKKRASASSGVMRSPPTNGSTLSPATGSRPSSGSWAATTATTCSPS